jgi:uncharacterized Zn-binding protein involved in type VI secretion
MPQPAARETDPVVGIDTHIVMVPSPGGPVPTQMPIPFSGKLQDKLSDNVLINGLKAATVDSIAKTTELEHMPPPSTTYQVTPNYQGNVTRGSESVLVNGNKLARVGDPVSTCNDMGAPEDSAIVSGSTNVMVG